MPVLEFNLQNTTRFDLLSIARPMLWATDADARDRAYQADLNEYFLTTAASGPIEKTDALLIHRGPRVSDIQKEVKQRRRFEFGVIVRLRLIVYLSRYPARPDLPILWSFREIEKRLTKLFKISASTINNTILPQYKSVAHLWGAYVLPHALHLAGPGAPFPCSREGLASFLGVAEALRLDAISKRVIRDDEDTWLLPPGLMVPQVDLPWQKTPATGCSNRH